MHKISLAPLLIGIVFVMSITTHFKSAHAEEAPALSEKRFAIGIGAAYVRFDSKYKFTNKDTGGSVFLDPEGNLGLPVKSNVRTIYGGYRFWKKHYFKFSHFGIDRESTVLSIDKNLDDLLIVNGVVNTSDKTNFYYLSYGYALFQDDRSRILGLVGINGLELKLDFQADGQIIYDGETITDGEYNEEVSLFVPLPLFGLDFSFAFTPKWIMSTKISLVGGKYEDVSAGVIQTSVSSIFKFTEHIGAMMGLTYFNSEVIIEDSNEKQEVNYGYGGAYVGIHFTY